MSEKLVLIDGHSILNRAFFGLPDLTNSEGLHTNAVYGFLNILFKILEEEQPDYLTVAFDVHAPTFRHKMYEAYKGTRKPMDDALRQQVPLMKEMLAAMGVCTIEMEGYEADDLLGTLAGMGERAGMEVSVVSGDRDLLQLATDHVRIRIPKTKRTGTEIEDYLAADVKERYQVTPKEFIDVKALMGDTADNIPGVPGIGEKTATALIGQYGCIEEVHAHADVVKPPRASKNIVEYWDQAVMSKELATIITDVPVDYDFANAKIDGKASLYTEEAYLLCKRLEFKNLLNRFTVDAPKNHAEESFQIVKDQKTADRIWKKAEGKAAGFYVVEQGVQNQQLSLFDTAEEQKFAGLAISFSEEDNYLMVASQELPAEKLKQDLLERQELYAADLKPALAAFDLHDVPEEMRTRFFDRTIAAYLLNPLKGAYPYEDIAKDYLGLMIPSRTDLLGKQMPGDVITEKEADVLRYACWESYITWKSAAVLKEGLKEHGMEQLMREIEMPLVFVLSDMEQDGICIDANALKEYGQKLSVSIGELEQKIYEEAGETFNINSPKQLGVILFEKMQLPNGKKTKTGFSTSAEVLEKLAGDYPIVADILEYRKLSKLKSTYADGLSNFIDATGKIHTTFHQTITATGRLSSTDPNLQNIPIRMELGRLIRKVFVPKEGYVFIDADYSQIELRVLAHMSGDQNLIAAYQHAEDIHRITASQVFHTPLEDVTDLQRRNAKAVNFGIVYGISDYGLSNNLGITRKQAKTYIDTYFERYPGIKNYMESVVREARDKGYVETLFHRRRELPDINSRNFNIRSFAERTAINSPIQGSAADILKVAMINLDKALTKEGLRARMLLQVHDEIVLEVPEAELEQVKALVTKTMENAIELAVPLVADENAGATWYEAK